MRSSTHTKETKKEHEARVLLNRIFACNPPRTEAFTLKELDILSEALMNYRDAKMNEASKPKKMTGTDYPGTLPHILLLVDEFCEAFIKKDSARIAAKVKSEKKKKKKVEPKMFTGILRGGKKKANAIGPAGTDPATW